MPAVYFIAGVILGWCGGFALAAILAAAGEADRQEHARLSVERDLQEIRERGF